MMRWIHAIVQLINSNACGEIKRVMNSKVKTKLSCKHQLINLLAGFNRGLNTSHQSTESGYLLELQNLHVYFNTSNGLLHAVRGVDLGVRPGEIIGVVGESGSGKSVMVKSLIGFNDHCRITADVMRFMDIDLGSLTSSWKMVRGNQIGYIPQDPLTSLNPLQKIGKQLYEAYYLGQKRRYEYKKALYKRQIYNARLNRDGNSASLIQEAKAAIVAAKQKLVANTKKAVADKKVLEILKFINIKNYKLAMDCYPHEFSGGMRQRIVIAMVLLGEPKVIIADEPTTALDVIVQAKVLDLLKRINAKFNIAIIMISHNIGMIANFCHYIYVMYAGEIVEKGSVYHLFTNPRHPYTWALISAIPDRSYRGVLSSVPGTPPNLIAPPVGDAFAPRNQYAMVIDFEQKPPMFQVDNGHYAATWLLHPDNPNKIDIPDQVQQKLALCRDAVINKERVLQAKLMHPTPQMTKSVGDLE